MNLIIESNTKHSNSSKISILTVFIFLIKVEQESDTNWPPSIGEFLIGAFEDGFYPG